MEAKQLIQLVHNYPARVDAFHALESHILKIPTELTHIQNHKFKARLALSSPVYLDIQSSYQEVRRIFDACSSRVRDFRIVYERQYKTVAEQLAEVMQDLEKVEQYRQISELNETQPELLEFQEISISLQDKLRQARLQVSGLFLTAKTYEVRADQMLEEAREQLREVLDKYRKQFLNLISLHRQSLSKITQDKLEEIHANPSILGPQVLKVVYSLQLAQQVVESSTGQVDVSQSEVSTISEIGKRIT